MTGTRISLPREDAVVTVRATDKVVLSLRTKDPAAAKALFTTAYGALCKHFEAVRAGPVSLNHKQIVALAGESYRRRMARLEAEYEPEDLQRDIDWHQDAIDEFRFGRAGDNDCDGCDEVPLQDAEFLAAIQRPSGVYRLAFELRADIESKYASATYAEALEHLFGEPADALCAERQLIIDPLTRTKLLHQIGRVVELAADRLLQTMSGDYSPDVNLDRFPAFDRPGANTPLKVVEQPKGKTVTVSELFRRWKTFNVDHVQPSTVRRYTPSIERLSAFLDQRDVRTITKSDIEQWADHRRDVDHIAPATVNRNDLVAAASLFSFATSRESDADVQGKKRPLRSDNPVKSVKLKEPAARTTREKSFRAKECTEILKLARTVVPDPNYPRASACRRFAPFICGYLGARIQEVCWLGKEDIRDEGAFFVVRFPRTKNGLARTVPIHDALIEEGLLDYWRSAQPGLLFAGDFAQKAGASRSQAEQRASELATWISANVVLSSGASPNHGWRHTFISRAQGPGVRMTREMACAIAGHNQLTDAHSIYENFSLEDMKTELDRFGRYVI